MAVLRVTEETLQMVNGEIERRNSKEGTPRYTQEALMAEIVKSWFETQASNARS